MNEVHAVRTASFQAVRSPYAVAVTPAPHAAAAPDLVDLGQGADVGKSKTSLLRKAAVTVVLGGGMLSLAGCGNSSVPPSIAKLWNNYKSHWQATPPIPQEPREVDMVYFYTDWCGVCKETKPETERFQNNYHGSVKFIPVNAEKYSTPEYERFGNAKQSHAIPEFMIVKDSKVQYDRTGYMSADDMQRLAEKYEAK